ncbi:signal recognition particle-docking protein FtsY [Mycoplasma phocoenae]|uniref:Signal recognition particle receptor FtsY n=1 Tax=Mycoplasma phocoenae TaxID=754517 RepID=A0A858U4B4_9MOLU|nr:signal recognition particle-docking protein FtsY [Mycoplasma phocoenae]QJG66871.1 signal recognition particle-docking protein FtsY [Mycoplasma phocoenae]
MGFFKRLKDRVFGSNNNVEAIENKIEKQKERKVTEKLIKEKKIDTYVAGLSKSNNSFSEMIKSLENQYNEIDEEYFEELEEILIMSDISMKLVDVMISEIKKAVKNENIKDPKLIKEIIADKLFTIYTANSVIDTTLNIEKDRLNVILMVGVNGVGKTTSIIKIAHSLKKQGLKVLVAAADTFRAAAVEQLEVWAQRTNVDLIKPIANETDPAAVTFRACDEAIKGNYDVLLIDTAGRLQNKVNLMNELGKLNKIISSKIEDAPHESLLVIDATTGQNGVNQAKLFGEVTKLSGIVLTKMDGTSKGGIVLTIRDEIGLNVKYIGLGEKLEDLAEFDLDQFIYALTKGLSDE